MDQVGKAYFVVLPDGDTPPNPAQVRSGQDAFSSLLPPTFRGTIDITASNIEYGGLASLLQTDMHYDVYIVAEDDDMIPNLQTSVTKIDTQTLDCIIPVFNGSFPISESSCTNLIVKVNIDEPGKAYFVVLTDGSSAPSPSQVKAGQDASGTSLPSTFTGVINIFQANSTYMGLASSLISDSSYDIYIVCEDDALLPNTMLSVSKIDANTDDCVPPIYNPSYPVIENIICTGFDVKVNDNEAGHAYFVILPDNATPPLAVQIKAGLNSSNVPVPANRFGIIDVLAADADYFTSVTGLITSTDYDVYIVAEDTATNPNLQLLPTKLDVKTADCSPPVFINNYPKISNITGDGFQVDINLNEVGTGYFVILQNGSPAPSSTQVKNGQTSTGFNLSANYKGTINILDDINIYSDATIGLLSETHYDVFVVAEDIATPENLQSLPVKIDVYTNDTTPPVFNTSYPTIVDVNYNYFNLLVNINETGKVYFVVLDDGATAPSPLQVKSGTDASGIPVLISKKGTIDILASFTSFSGNSFGLTTLADYDVYLIAEDDAYPNNLQHNVVKLNVTTVDLMAPYFNTSYPMADNITETTFDIKVNMDEAGKSYFVVLGDGAVSPTPQQVKNGQHAGGMQVASTFRATINVASPNTEYSGSASALTQSTHYDVFVIAEDEQTIPNLQATVIKIDVFTLPTSGILNIDGNTTVKLFPNPANEYTTIRINSPHTGLFFSKIFNINGKEMSNYEFKAVKGENDFIININDWPTGIYFANIYSDNYQAVIKLIVN